MGLGWEKESRRSGGAGGWVDVMRGKGYDGGMNRCSIARPPSLSGLCREAADGLEL